MRTATSRRWAKITPVLFVSAAAAFAPAAFATQPQAGEAGRSRVASSKPAALPAAPTARGAALALFASAVANGARATPQDAARNLRAAQPQLPELADYVAFHLATALFAVGDFAAVPGELPPVWSMKPSSPLVADAAMLAARAWIQAANPAAAAAVLKEHYEDLPQPEGDFLAGECARASNDLASAARHFQRVYYRYPATQEAERAVAELQSLRAALGDLYPPASPELMLARAERWERAAEYRRARAEYTNLVQQLTGAERDIARVRIGVMDYRTYSNEAAYSYLAGFSVDADEADAERLYYMLEAARRLERDDYIANVITEFARRHPHSPWRMRSLISAGNYYLVRNDAARYIPLYGACADGFPEESRADYCHWKIVWNAYINRREDARDLLRQHLVRYPGSSRASAALYFLGRLAEQAGRTSEAKEYYAEAAGRFPNHYYGTLAESRLSEPAIFRAVASPGVAEYLRTIVWPVPRFTARFDPAPATQARLERSRLLASAGLDDLSERELRHGARTENQPHVIAVHLAQTSERYASAFQGLRLLKALVPGYLSFPFEAAPARFWRLLYPLPWRASLESNARQRGLDPFVVAGLIRQESEFNPNAVSPANAYGLTQVMPSTGRQLLRMSRRRFRARILFQPELNLRLGTTYLRHVLDSYSGKWELALAAYNAGPTRVQNWITWADYREQAEFIETIPFTETREYVLAVLRNAEMYRRLYAGEPVSSAVERKLRPAPKQTIERKEFKRSPVVKPRATKKPSTRRKKR